MDSEAYAKRNLFKWLSGWAVGLIGSVVLGRPGIPFWSGFTATVCLFGVGWFAACALISLWDSRKEEW